MHSNVNKKFSRYSLILICLNRVPFETAYEYAHANYSIFVMHVLIPNKNIFCFLILMNLDAMKVTVLLLLNHKNSWCPILIVKCPCINYIGNILHYVRYENVTVWIFILHMQCNLIIVGTGS